MGVAVPNCSSCDIAYEPSLKRSIPAACILILLGGCSDDSPGADAATDTSVRDAVADAAADADGSSDGSTDAATDSDGAPVRPVVTLTVQPMVVTEVPTTMVEFSLTFAPAPPVTGTRVYVLGDVAQNLTQLNLPAISVDPSANDAPRGDLDFSGFTLLATTSSVTVSVPSFDDGNAEMPQDVSFRIVPFEDVPWGELPVDGAMAAGPYDVGDPGTATITLRDAPE